MVSTNISRQEKRLKSDGVSIKDMGRKPDLFKNGRKVTLGVMTSLLEYITIGIEI